MLASGSNGTGFAALSVSCCKPQTVLLPQLAITLHCRMMYEQEYKKCLLLLHSIHKKYPYLSMPGIFYKCEEFAMEMQCFGSKGQNCQTGVCKQIAVTCS